MSSARKFLVLAAILASGTVFQLFPSGCVGLGLTQAAAAFDFCFVFNCTGGSFFNLCEPVRLFVDCPAAA